MVQKTKRTRTGNSANTRGGKNKSDRMGGAHRKYVAGGYKDKKKMTSLTRVSGGKYQTRRARVERQRKIAKIQSQIKSLKTQLSTAEKKLKVLDAKWQENYDECRKKGIYNAVTYGIIGDYNYLDDIKDPAKRQLALRYIARHNEINKKRGQLISTMMSIKGEIYTLSEQLKKLK